MHEKINMKVALQFSNELRNAKWERKSMGDTWIILLGEQLTQHSKTLARTLFADVVVQQVAVRTPGADVDAILIPKIVFAEQSLGIWKWSEAVLTIALEWTLKSLQDETIWVDTVKGEGKGETGNLFTHKTETAKRVKILVEDVFQKSFQAISSAQAIKEFAERKGQAFYLVPLDQNSQTEIAVVYNNTVCNKGVQPCSHAAVQLKSDAGVGQWFSYI